MNSALTESFVAYSTISLRQTYSAYRLQRNFYDHIICSEKELSDHLRYVVENPIRRGLVAQWQDFPFTGSLGISIQSVFTRGGEGRKIRLINKDDCGKIFWIFFGKFFFP